MPPNSPLHFSTSLTIMYLVKAAVCFMHYLNKTSTTTERKLIKPFMLEFTMRTAVTYERNVSDQANVSITIDAENKLPV